MNTERPWAIFDLDNCIADDEWRIPHIRWHKRNPDARYHDYHHLAPFDRSANLVHVFSAQDCGTGIIISTARPVAFRAATAEWLKRNGVRDVHLLMRNNTDHRHTVDVKRGHLAVLPEYGIDLAAVSHAYDDRPDVVAMYAAAGIPNPRILAVHDVCAYTPPPLAEMGAGV